MADLTGDFRFLAESARRFVGLLAARKAFERQGERQERERGAALIRHVDHTAKGIEAQISKVEAQYLRAANDPDRREAVKRMRFIAAYAHFMRRALPWLEDASNPPLELGALYFIDRLARVLIRGPVDVVPTRADEYSTEQRPFEPLFARLGLKSEGGHRPIILNFPALESESFPLLPLFGHELGHTAIREGGLVAAALEAARKDTAFNLAVRRSVDALAVQRPMSHTSARIVIDERLEDWVEELLCDQLAMQHIGPSFLLAFSAFLAPLSWNETAPRHPPTTLRIAHLLAWIAQTPWEGLLERRMPNVLQWLEGVAVTPRPDGTKPSMTALLDAVDLARECISNVAQNHLLDQVYNPNDYLGKAAHLDELLRYEVLPVQHPITGEAFEPRAILLAGWLSIQDEVGRSDAVETPAVLAGALSKSDSNAFFTKALEMSAILSAWGELG